MTLYLVTGPPCSGKSTYVREHAKPGDITIDYDAIANVLTPEVGASRAHPPHVKQVTKAARQAAIDAALDMADAHDVYVIHSMPGARLLDLYRTRGAHFITVDPGQATVLARCKRERPWQMQQAVKQWYRERPSKLDTEPSKLGSTAMGW